MRKNFTKNVFVGMFAVVVGIIVLFTPLTVNAANFSQYATVGGDGVRLRKTPSFDGVILELMYRSDHIWIDTEYSGSYWIHVKRELTNTIGYMGYDLYDHS